MCKMNVNKILLALIVCITQTADAQTYTVDYTFEYSYNSRIKQDGKFGLIDKNNKLIIPAIYEEVNDFNNGYARVVKSGKVGFVNLKAEQIIPCIYDKDEQIIIGAAVVYVINPENNVTKIDIYADERRMGFKEDLVCVIKNGKYGFINKDNKTIIPFQYDGADNFYDSIAIIKQNNKYGAIDKTGKIVIPVVYDLLVWDIGNTSSLFTQKNGECFYMDKKQTKIRNCGE